jgi:hypothetical protein
MRRPASLSLHRRRGGGNHVRVRIKVFLNHPGARQKKGRFWPPKRAIWTDQISFVEPDRPNLLQFQFWGLRQADHAVENQRSLGGHSAASRTGNAIHTWILIEVISMSATNARRAPQCSPALTIISHCWKVSVQSRLSSLNAVPMN